MKRPIGLLNEVVFSTLIGLILLLNLSFLYDPVLLLLELTLLCFTHALVLVFSDWVMFIN